MPEQTRERFAVYPLELGGLVSEAMVTASAGHGRERRGVRREVSELTDERERLGVESLVAVPLRAASGCRWRDLRRSEPAALARSRPQAAPAGVAEQTGVALERARLFETEREARRLAELLERNAAHLAAAMTVRDIASSTVADLESAGIGRAIVHVRGGDGMDVMAAATMSQEEVERLSPAPIDGTRSSPRRSVGGVTIDVATGEEHDARFPGSAFSGGGWRWRPSSPSRSAPPTGA